MKREEIRWALVTGASSGIGEHLCYFLANKGINLLISGRNKARLNALADKLKSDVLVEVIAADLADRHERMLLTDAIRKYIPELVVNNGGFGLYGDALTHETEAQMQILEVNGNALLELSLVAARALISEQKKGVILNVASAAAFPIFPRLATYSAAKAFVVKFSESFDEETKPFGVRVLASCPGMVDTNFRVRAGGETKNDTSFSDKSMTLDFAVSEIWRQIQNEKKIHIFSWLYRMAIVFVHYLLPKKWVAAKLKANIDARHPPQPIINYPPKE